MGYVEEAIEDIKKTTGRYQKEFASLDAETMDAKPSPEAWSINECLDHIVVSNGRYHGIFDAIEKGTLPRRGWARVPLVPRIWGRLILTSVLPSTARKTKTFAVFQPSKSRYGRNLVPDLVAANEALIARLARIKDADLDRIIVTSPTAPFVVYPLRACIDILAEHEKRHFNQALRVKQGLPQEKPA